MMPQEFIAQVAPGAIAAYQKYRISAALTIAQAALETGWGQGCPGNNMFGIKADPSWNGPVTSQRTWEVYNGQKVVITANFRAYPSLAASIEDHAAFLYDDNSPTNRYKNLIGADYVTACNEIAKVDGYATDPNYGEKLLEIIHANDLAKYDAPPEHWAVMTGWFPTSDASNDGAKTVQAKTGYHSWSVTPSEETKQHNAVVSGWFGNQDQATKAASVIKEKTGFNAWPQQVQAKQ